MPKQQLPRLSSSSLEVFVVTPSWCKLRTYSASLCQCPFDQCHSRTRNRGLTQRNTFKQRNFNSLKALTSFTCLHVNPIWQGASIGRFCLSDGWWVSLSVCGFFFGKLSTGAYCAPVLIVGKAVYIYTQILLNQQFLHHL